MVSFSMVSAGKRDKKINAFHSRTSNGRLFSPFHFVE